MSLAPVLSSAQDVEPDELGFVIGTPDVLKPAEGARSVIIYGNPSKPGMYVMQITWPPALVVARTFITLRATSTY